MEHPTGHPRKAHDCDAPAGQPHHAGPHAGSQEETADYSIVTHTQQAVSKWQPAAGMGETGTSGVLIQAEASVSSGGQNDTHGNAGMEVHTRAHTQISGNYPLPASLACNRHTSARLSSAKGVRGHLK